MPARRPNQVVRQIELPVRELLNTRTTLRNIRNYLAGQVVGFTRDEALLEEVLKCAFCRVHLERTGHAYGPGAAVSESAIADQYNRAFDDIRAAFPTLFASSDRLLLEPPHLAYVDRAFASLGLSEASHDIVGDIYETFIGTGYRGQEGQFFTPKTAVRTLVALTNPTPEDLMIDPASGSGSLLLEAACHITEKGPLNASRIHGVDKDEYLARLSQLHLALQFQTLFPINCADSLLWEGNGFETSPTKLLFGQFTLILTNPPFGSKIIALMGEDRSKFELAHTWRYSRKTGRYHKQSKLAPNTPPQVLFVERCISLLADGGRLGIVLPESVLSSPKHRYVMQYVLDHTTPIAVIGMPESLFKTSGRGGTHTKVCLVVLQKVPIPADHRVFMAEAEWCGHDSRGREISKDDLPAIVENFQAFQDGRSISPSHLGFLVDQADLRDNILAPRAYDPEPIELLADLERTHTLYRFSTLIEEGLISLATGDEVGKLAYGTGEIPFVRTSDISNWEIKVDPKHGVSEEIYQSYAAKQDVREGDILMVRDGTYLIGTCAYISGHDTRIVYQSHLYKIRVNEGAPFDNYLLLAILSSPPVAAQIKAFSFTQDIINSLGTRIHDLLLPVPKSVAHRKRISDTVKQAVESRIAARELTRSARLDVVASE